MAFREYWTTKGRKGEIGTQLRINYATKIPVLDLWAPGGHLRAYVAGEHGPNSI